MQTLKVSSQLSPPHTVEGSLLSLRGDSLSCRLPHACIGDLFTMKRSNGSELLAQVVAFDGPEICLIPFGSTKGLAPGTKVRSFRSTICSIPRHPHGTVLNCFGRCHHESRVDEYLPLQDTFDPIPPLSRQLSYIRFHTGIPVLDILSPLAKGQRVGIFAPAGLGKSTLLAKLTEASHADTVVIALVGERGREIPEFIHGTLTEQGRKRSIIITSTSDEAPSQQFAALLTATKIAEHERTQGKDVLLLVDSLTRAARALRDIGLSSGEPPVRLGYPASVFRTFPTLIERAGNLQSGSITAIYTILTEQIEALDPFTDELRSLLDGHVMLSPHYATRGLRPAVDPTHTLSRLATHLWSDKQAIIANKVRSILCEARELRETFRFTGNHTDYSSEILQRAQKIESLLYASDGAESENSRWQQLESLSQSLPSS